MAEQPAACILGNENRTRLDDLENRVVRLENRKTNGDGGMVRYAGMILAIAGAMYGATAWVGRDVDVLRAYMYDETAKIRNRIGQAEEHASEGHPVKQTVKIGEMESRMVRIEERIEKQLDSLDEKLQIEVKQGIDTSKLANDHTKARLDKLEEWQRWLQRRPSERGSE
jgi:septation ring formation regulator EzrA